MGNNNSWKGEISIAPCPAGEFSGRHKERLRLIEVLQVTKERSQVILVSGRRGSGKSSFLNWAENEIQSKTGGDGCPAIKKGFSETPGMVIETYRDLLVGMKEYKKFGWFSKTLDDSKVKKYFDISMSVLEKLSPLAGPYGAGVNAAAIAAKGIVSSPTADYAQLRSSFLSVLSGISEELVKKDKIMAILLDDVQWSTDPDFQLLKDLMKVLPSRIVLIISFRLEAKSEKRYIELKEEVARFHYTEIKLAGMDNEGIVELAKNRYDLHIDDTTADFLAENIGDPFCLVNSFNLLQRQKSKADIAHFQEIKPQVIDDAWCIFAGLNEAWQDRISSLCILRPPMFLSVISCMLKENNKARLKQELEHNLILIRLDRERYDFAHPALREYCREMLTPEMVKELNSRAAKCLESMGARI